MIRRADWNSLKTKDAKKYVIVKIKTSISDNTY